MNKQEQRQELWSKVLYNQIAKGQCANYAKVTADEALKAFDETFAEGTIKESLTDEPTQPETESWESILKGALGEVKIVNDSSTAIYFEYNERNYKTFKDGVDTWEYDGHVLPVTKEAQEIKGLIKAYLNPPIGSGTILLEDSPYNETVTLTREEADEMWKYVMYNHGNKGAIRAKELLKIKS